jgi:hypothetical protein
MAKLNVPPFWIKTPLLLSRPITPESSYVTCDRQRGARLDDERILAAVDKIAICQIKSETAATGESDIASDYVSAAAGAQGGKRTPPPRTKPALVGVSKVMLPDGANGRLIVCVMGEAGLPLKTIVPFKPKLFPANVNAPAKKRLN